MEPEERRRISVGSTVEQCWHAVPGGTAKAALQIAREFATNPAFVDEVDLHMVAGRHPVPPPPMYRPTQPVAMLPLGRTALYESWTRINWPKVEAVTEPIDVAHATGLIPCATSVPLVVTIHDVAFLASPDRFTRHGVRLMTRSLAVSRRRAARVICSSQSTFEDLVEAGFNEATLRLVPLGVDAAAATADEVEEARSNPQVPERFVLFVGTLEPRKNLRRLIEAMSAVQRSEPDLAVVVVGADGWGDVRAELSDADLACDVRFLGAVSEPVLRGLYSLAEVFAYPSEAEGFGLPVAEAMAHGAPVVTSRGTSTEEVAGGAAVLVDPFDVDDIGRGVLEAMSRRDELTAAGKVRARSLTWERSAKSTLDVYRELVS